MKITIDKRGRKLYKFSHSACQGGFMFSNKVLSGSIVHKDEFRYDLEKVRDELELIDVTIKIYNDTFFIFLMMKPSISIQIIIDKINEVSSKYGNFSKDYFWSNVYDLQEQYIKQDLEKLGFNYDEG